MSSMMNFTYDSKPIFTIENEISNKGRQGGINLQPSYQRGYVWNNDFKNKLIYSIIRKFPIGNITLRLNKGIKEVVDGQQRLTTIDDFINDKFYISGEYAKKIIFFINDYLSNSDEHESNSKLIKLTNKLTNKTGAKFKYSNLPETIKNDILAYNISFTNIADADDQEIIEYFRFLQNQERLRAGEIINSFPSTSLDKILKEIDNLPLFLNKIGFKSNQRHEFDKHFYSIVGLISKKINYGVTDKQVIDFALKAEKTLGNNPHISQMVNNINDITRNEDVESGCIKFSNVRSTKYLLLILAFNYIDIHVDINKKLKNLSSLNEKFSVFNSAKEGETDKAFAGYDTKVIDDFRNITLISKGSHNLEDVSNNMKKLGYYIENFNNENTIPF